MAWMQSSMKKCGLYRKKLNRNKWLIIKSWRFWKMMHNIKKSIWTYYNSKKGRNPTINLWTLRVVVESNMEPYLEIEHLHQVLANTIPTKTSLWFVQASLLFLVSSFRLHRRLSASFSSASNPLRCVIMLKGPCPGALVDTEHKHGLPIHRQEMQNQARSIPRGLRCLQIWIIAKWAWECP